MSYQSNILVVEDRQDWQGIVCNAIRSEGRVPHPADSYQAALQDLGKQKFDLAVIDPVLDRDNRFNRDGLSVIQKINELKPTMPVIILTGSLTHDLATSLERLCPDMPILFKESWNPAEFSDLIRKLIGEQWRLVSTQKDQQYQTPQKTSVLPTMPTPWPVVPVFYWSKTARIGRTSWLIP